MRTVCIYPGRFQPFHKSHYDVYKYVCAKFGKGNVYIVTSNKVQQGRSPFNFNQKKSLMMKLYGIPASNIINNNSPYKTQGFDNIFDANNTAIVYVSTQKDPRLKKGAYFKGDIPKDPKPYSQQAYTVPVPLMSNKILGQQVSGTIVRNVFKSETLSIDQKKKVFRQLFGKFDQGIFKLIMSRLGGNLQQSIISGNHVNRNQGQKCVILTGIPLKGKFTKIFGSNATGQIPQLIPTSPQVLMTDNMAVRDQGNILVDMRGFDPKKVRQTVLNAAGQGFETLIMYIMSDIGSALKRNEKLPKPIDKDKVKELYKYVLIFKKQLKNLSDYFSTVIDNDSEDVNMQITDKAKTFLAMTPKQDTQVGYDLYQSLLTQGIFDKGNFKCVFLSGPPGAGKSTIGNDLFKVQFNMSAYGLKVVNPDYALIKQLQKNNIPLDMADPNHSWEIKDQQQAIRKKTKQTTNKILVNFLEQRKGIIIDLTGNSIGPLLRNKQIAEANGYDTMMIFVDVSLETSLKRNKMRQRVVPEQVVKDIYYSVQENKKEYQRVFGKNFINIQNQGSGGIDLKIRKAVQNFIKTPPKNPVAKQWIEAQKRNRGIKQSIITYNHKCFKQNNTTITQYNKKQSGKNPMQNKQVKQKWQKSITSEQLINQIMSSKDSMGTKVLLQCGGASGHMLHPFQDNNLTFNDFKTIINRSLMGKLDIQNQATMKYDGQNIQISWKNGKIIGARNKGNLKNFGETALDINGMKSKFAGRGDLQNAFVFALIDLQRAFGALGAKKVTDIFENGRKWIALQIIYPKTANVIPYDTSMLVLHNVIQIDENGNQVNVDVQAVKAVYSSIQQVNANVQKHFSINPPTIVKMPKIKDFSARRAYFMSRLQRLQSKYKLSGKDTLGDYNDAYWKQFIVKQAKTMNYNVPKQVMDGLIKRWSRFNKTYTISQLRNDITDDNFRNWALNFDKNDHQGVYKQNSYDWQILFLELGAEIMLNLSNYMIVNPDKAVQKMALQLQTVVDQIKNSNNISVINKLQAQLKRLNAIGGIGAIVPTEGIVFSFRGNTYKATGIFADLNQILGTLKYAR